MLSARIPTRIGLVTAVAFGVTALVPPAQAHSAPAGQFAQSGGCSLVSFLCLPLKLTLPVEPVNLTGGSAPLTLDVGGVQVDLDATIDLASLEDVESALALVNSVDAGLEVQAEGVTLDAFGVGAYAVDDFRVSAGAVYNQEALLGPEVYVADLLQLSAQSTLSRAAGVNVGDDVSVDVVEYAAAQAELENGSETTLLGGDGLATSSADTLRLSGAGELFNLAHLGAGGTDTYVVESARLSAQAANDLLAELAQDDALVHVADSTRLSSQAVVDTIASTTDADGEYDELIGSLTLDADATNDLLAEIAAGPDSSTQLNDDLDVVLRLLFGGFGG